MSDQSDVLDLFEQGMSIDDIVKKTGIPYDDVVKIIGDKKNYQEEEPETSGDWNMRYNQGKPSLKRDLDRIAQEMFKQNFSDLDNNEQEKVINWLGTDRVIEGAGREFAQSRSLSEIMKRAGNFSSFKDQALREGYTEEDIEKYLQENRMDTDLEMFGATKETAQKESLDVLWRDKDNVDHFVKMALDVGYDFGEVESFLKRKGIQVE